VRERGRLREVAVSVLTYTVTAEDWTCGKSLRELQGGMGGYRHAHLLTVFSGF